MTAEINLLTGLNGSGRLRYTPSHGGEERDPVLGDRQHARARRIDDETPVLVRGRQIHVVYTDPGDTHHPQPPLGALEQLFAELRPAADDHGIAVADSAAELVGPEVKAAVNFVGLTEEGQPRIPDPLSHEDRRPHACGWAGEAGGPWPWKRAADVGKAGLRGRESEEGGTGHFYGTNQSNVCPVEQSTYK